MKKQDKQDKQDLYFSTKHLKHDADSELSDMLEAIDDLDEEYISQLGATIQRLEENYNYLSQAIADQTDNTYAKEEKQDLQDIKQIIELLKLRKESLPGLIDCEDRLELAKMLATTYNKVYETEEKTGKKAKPKRKADLIWVDESHSIIYKYKDLVWIDISSTCDLDAESEPFYEIEGLYGEELEHFVDFTNYYNAFIYVEKPTYNKPVKKVWLCGAEYYDGDHEDDFVEKHVKPALKTRLKTLLKDEFGMEM